MKALRLQDNLGNQNFNKGTKGVFEPVTKTVKDGSQDVTGSKTATSFDNNNALEILNDKFSEITNDSSVLATYSLSPLSKIIILEHTSQFTQVKYSNSSRVNDLFLNRTIPVTLSNNLLMLRDTDKKFQLQKDLLKMILGKNYKVDLASLPDKN